MIFGQNLEHEKAVGYMKLEKKHTIYEQVKITIPRMQQKNAFY